MEYKFYAGLSVFTKVTFKFKYTLLVFYTKYATHGLAVRLEASV